MKLKLRNKQVSTREIKQVQLVCVVSPKTDLKLWLLQYTICMSEHIEAQLPHSVSKSYSSW